MKKIILLAALITIQFSYSQKQFSETEKLSSLCKVWGFLKYYHPNVAKGDYNWDEQLLIIIPKVEKAGSKVELSEIYLDWIESLGAVKVCKSCGDVSKKEYFDKNFDLSWTQNTETFTDELAKKLKYIENNRFQGNNYYVVTTNNGNIKVQNEPRYQNFEFPEPNYRILSLFRYWNVVDYFFPYKYQTDENWNDVLSEMIPKFINSKTATEYHLAMLETVIKLDDSHANFYTAKIHDFFGRKYIPAYFNIIENKAVITGFYNDSLAKMNNINIGDVIEKIEEMDVSDIIIDRKKYINGSNEKTKAKNYDFFVFNGVTDSVQLKIKRGQTEFIKNIGRFDEKYFKNKTTQNQEKYKILQGNIGYADMSYLEMKDIDKMMLELKSTKSIIIDYRKFMNFTPYMIARRLIQTEKEFARLTEPDLSYPGRFIWKKPEMITPIKNEYYAGKIIILVNEQTQSAAEYATMLLQTADDVTTIGSQTAGADGDVSYIEFVGFKSYITGIGVFYPDGTETQRKGVKVDVEVRPTIKGIQEGKDEVLERAIEFVNNRK